MTKCDRRLNRTGNILKDSNAILCWTFYCSAALFSLCSYGGFALLASPFHSTIITAINTSAHVAWLYNPEETHTYTDMSLFRQPQSKSQKIFNKKKHKISQQPANMHIREAVTMKYIDVCLENDLKDNKIIFISGWIKLIFFHYHNLTWPPHSHSAAAFRLCWQNDKNVLQQTDEQRISSVFSFISWVKSKIKLSTL